MTNFPLSLSPGWDLCCRRRGFPSSRLPVPSIRVEPSSNRGNRKSDSHTQTSSRLDAKTQQWGHLEKEQPYLRHTTFSNCAQFCVTFAEGGIFTKRNKTCTSLQRSLMVLPYCLFKFFCLFVIEKVLYFLPPQNAFTFAFMPPWNRKLHHNLNQSRYSLPVSGVLLLLLHISQS